MFTRQLRTIKGIAGELQDFVTREDQHIEACLGPFMDKLATLSAEYEVEKASLEREMLDGLEKSKIQVVTDIVEQRASARHYSNMVEEHYVRTQNVIKEGLQSRRDAEKRFTERMMDVVRSEYENIVAGMRSEDRKKLHHERVENHKKLESCRIAVRLDLAAMLQQQRSTMERQRKEEIARFNEQIVKERLEMETSIAEMQQVVDDAKMSQQNSRVELKVVSEKQRKTIELLENEILGLSTNIRSLQQSNILLQKEANRCLDEADAAVEDKRLTVESMREEMVDMVNRMALTENEVRAREAELQQKVYELQYECKKLDKEHSVLKKERDGLQRDKNEVAGNMLFVKKSYADLVDGLEKKLAAAESECAELRVKAREIQTKMSKTVEDMELLKTESEASARDREEHWLKLNVDHEAGSRKTLLELNEMRANVGIWLHDQINLRRGQPVDMAFDGDVMMMMEARKFFESAESHDLLTLYKIATDQNMGLYAKSPDRVLVSRMELSQGLGKVQAEWFGGVGKTESAAEDLDAVVKKGAGKEKELHDKQSKESVPGGMSKADVDMLIDAQTARLRKEYEDKISSLTIEWRAKAVSLAQRLERTEKELNYPRADDVTKISELERQVSVLMLALEGAAAAGSAKSAAQARAPSRQGSNSNPSSMVSGTGQREGGLVRMSSTRGSR